MKILSAQSKKIKEQTKKILSKLPASTLRAIILLLIFAAVPLTVYVAQQNQDIRQRAECNPDTGEGCDDGAEPTDAPPDASGGDGNCTSDEQCNGGYCDKHNSPDGTGNCKPQGKVPDSGGSRSGGGGGGASKTPTCKSKTGRPISCACSDNNECASKYCALPITNATPTPTKPADPKAAKKQEKELKKQEKKNKSQPPGICSTISELETASRSAGTDTFTPQSASESATTTIATQSASVPLVFSISLSGIGKGGNLNPQHPERTVTLSLYRGTSSPSTANLQGLKPTLQKSTKVIYTSDGVTAGFIGSDDLQSDFGSGPFVMIVSMPGYLPYIENINVPANTKDFEFFLVNALLVAGDVNNDGKLDILDWNKIIDKTCYTDQDTVPGGCSDQMLQTVDVNDDGQVNAVDANIFVKNLKNIATPR